MNKSNVEIHFVEHGIYNINCFREYVVLFPKQKKISIMENLYSYNEINKIIIDGDVIYEI